MELCKNGLNDLDNSDGMITYLEPDILECEVKWALGSIESEKESESEVAQLCLTLCDPVDCSPTGSFICGIL